MYNKHHFMKFPKGWNDANILCIAFKIVDIKEDRSKFSGEILHKIMIKINLRKYKQGCWQKSWDVYTEKRFFLSDKKEH